MHVELRLLTKEDNITELTALLHRAYSPLAERGMKYLASHQDEKTTLSRAEKGECYLAFYQNELVGTVTLYPPEKTNGCPWYDRSEIASFGQFAVKPEVQGLGIGRRLMNLVEERAKELGAREIALDTSEHAKELIQTYTKRGYRFVEHTRWEEVNYRSVVLSKPL